MKQLYVSVRGAETHQQAHAALKICALLFGYCTNHVLMRPRQTARAHIARRSMFVHIVTLCLHDWRKLMQAAGWGGG